jgi:hypothetical protein
MTTPRVIELPRRLEATSADTFLAVLTPDTRPLAPVVSLHSRSGRPRADRVTRPVLSLVDGPGDDAA